MTDIESSTSTKRMKEATVFLFVVANGTCVFIAYLLHRVGLPLGLIATVVIIGAVLSNLALYAGIRFATWMLRKSD